MASYRQPKLIEDRKQTIFVRGRKTSDLLLSCMRDLYALKKPDATFLQKKNDIVPFENIVPVEAFCKKLTAALFVFGCSNKKRPNDLILGRTFHHQLLDMIELGVTKYKGIKDFNCEKIAVGLKPCILFAGDFQSKPELVRLKNLLVDLFQREEVRTIRLQGIEHVLMFTAVEDDVYVRSYRILLKKSASTLPRIELDEIGPSIDLKLRRTKLASDDLLKTACKKPKELKAKKVKNVSKDVFGTTEARIHVSKQNISSLKVKKMKGLKGKRNRNPKKKSANTTAEAGKTNDVAST